MQYVGEYQGYKLYFSNISYQCPDLKIYGERSERTLKNSIDRLLKKREAKKQKAGLF